MEPGDCFVFAGAGVSFSNPSNLPVFWQIRDALLKQLELSEYVLGTHDTDTDKVTIANGLLPEPFLLALHDAGVPVRQWLGDVLGRGKPNAAHHALGQLARRGAAVWTVNFDRLIESASGDQLVVVAWPSEPVAGAQLLKPHGTLSGELIMTARQVLGELPAPWREQLRRDVAGRVVMFIGYSGNDLDFRPIWDDVLQDAQRVIWFDMPERTPALQAHRDQAKRLLLRRTHAAGLLDLRTSRASGDRPANAAQDFVRFCIDNALVEVDSRMVDDLCSERETPVWPRLGAGGPTGQANVLQALGDTAAARASLTRLIRNGPARTAAIRQLAKMTVNHGGRPVARALGVAAAVPPPIGSGRRIREQASRKRITILANRGMHSAVLRATADLAVNSRSTELILRSASERFLISLDTAIVTASTALERAHREQHNILVAHAAFQLAMALIWAERLDEAERCLDEHLEPFASLAANRWVAWSDFARAALLLRSDTADDAEEALRRLELAKTRFQAEALIDGVISVDTITLTAKRRTNETGTFLDDAQRVARRITGRPPSGKLYTRGHRFALEAVDLEVAEYTRTYLVDHDTACATFQPIARSAYPLHQGLGHLGLAMSIDDPQRRNRHARAARDIGTGFGSRLIVARATALLNDAPDASAAVYFC